MAVSRPSSPKASGTFDAVSRSAEQTEQLGEQLGRALKAGDVVGLFGELGTGKTTLVRGLAKGVGLDPDVVKSPTFVLLREYPGTIPLIHIDGYRLEGSGTAVVWEDPDWLFSPKKITVIEWADRFGEWLPDDAVQVHLAHKTTNQRTLRITGQGPRAAALVAALAASQTHEPAGH